MSMSMADRARLGGQAVAKKYGSDYMASIGRRGAESFWQKYKIAPLGTAGWAIICRATNQIVGRNNYKGLERKQ